MSSFPGQPILSRQTPFDLFGELPEEATTMLEASAGTGKTFTIAALVTRYVAEGLARMDDLLVVSFSRESTRELRERVRERLVSARDGLALADPSMIDPNDRVLVHLADTVDEARRRRRLERLEIALAAFDAATVTTIHGFCQQVLTTLGTNGDHDPGTVLVEDIGDLVREVADDLYLRKWGFPGAGTPDLGQAEFHQLAIDAVAEAADLVPDPGVGGTPGLRARIAQAVRAEVERRKRRLGVFGYDDMLTRLAGTLTDPQSGPAACRRLRERYRFVLVDEFQDTDPVQWEIIRRPFHGHSTLILIGDPKQAVYGFRGADVQAYLNAFESAETVRTLPTSYRSDAALLRGLDTLFQGAALGDERIRVQPVQAFHPGPMVTVEGSPAPVRLRVLPRDAVASTQQSDLPQAPLARDAVQKDLVAEVVRLLSGAARVQPRDGSPERDLRPGDIAVLVRANYQAQDVSAGLAAAGVPAVVTGRTNVFSTPAAQEWQLLLEAMEQPHRTTRVRRLALSCFGGHTAPELDQQGAAIDEELALRLRDWGHLLTENGVGAMFETVARQTGLQRRLLGMPRGERLLTDLRHVTQALQEASETSRLGLSGLLLWLRHRQEEAAGSEGALERSRRLESDAAAVQVMTVHTSKGLEFPVVLVPFAWNQRGSSRDDVTAVTFHADGRRFKDIGGPGWKDWGRHVEAADAEDAAEELRLTYVALTRAQSHLVLWWAPTHNTRTAPLHRILFNPDPEQPVPQSVRVPSDPGALADFERLAGRSGGTLAVELMQPRRPEQWEQPAPQAVPLRAATLGRELDQDWRRTSYSSLTASAHENQGSSSEPEVALKDDEGPDELAPGPLDDGPDEPLRRIASAWNDLPAGARFGTLVHEVLELAADAGNEDELRTTVAARVARSGPAVDVETLVSALVPAVSTPLHLNQLTLRDIDARDRLSELDFELPLAGGDDPVTTRVLLSDLVPLWRHHCPPGQLLSRYAEALDDLEAVPLRGYLTGSIDAVLRVHSDSGPRFVVVDYKTNRLGTPDEPVTAWHYRPSAMEEAMIAAHYPLQALLYGVALHRFLRWRQPGYDPAQHLGGVRYLFLRGMSGPDVHSEDGTAPGVFCWEPPTALVTATSDLLAGRS
ncbi:RecBCD enzyme subunit RecB [Kineosporia sp. NBRC 101677]|uniref:UvrD-helicase domain-containing protein n=1 Tax=Kineosporia sp. NBRC 101677 TaxID=3032197 RepID=UPI0024A4F39A|nr:UvrD-helicase domain-containing protein [Kineosporia sp. NBRC 101677]GLY14412.1 RecBCD enzyme subunit RecB [Kineosporia sp. NBRC 101677]